MKASIWGIGDLYEVCIGRANNKLNTIIAWSGGTGAGKSTGAWKLGRRFKCFKPWKHITYSAKEDMKLIEENKFIYVLDDEAIRAAYKRNYASPEHKILVQMLNTYRNHYNTYSFCIPRFYSLDKDLRSLIKIHIHIIERGLGVIHLPRDDVLYSDDIWDVAHNEKIEKSWTNMRKRNPHFKPPYHKLSTFAGYIKYGAMSSSAEALYEKIKATKRKTIFDEQIMKELEGEDKDQKDNNNMYQSITNKLLEKYKSNNLIDKDELFGLASYVGKDIVNFTAAINRTLRVMNANLTLSQMTSKDKKKEGFIRPNLAPL